MADDLFRKLKPERHEEDRPIDRVEPCDILADHMDVGRPVFRECFGLYLVFGVVSERRDVV